MISTEVTVLTVVYVVTMLVAFIGNTLLIYIVWKKPDVRSLTSVMFVNMAVADLLVTLVVMPYSVAHLHTGGKWLIVKGLAGEITCRAVFFVGMLSITASILCLTSMALDRCVAVVYPLRRLQWFRKPKFLVPLIWILSSALMSICLVITDFNPETAMCEYNFRILPGDVPQAIRGIFIYLFIVNYLIPLSATSILYAKTAHTLWFRQVPGHRYSQSQRQQEITKRRVVRMLIIVVTAFALCWLPGQVYQLIRAVTAWANNFPALVMIFCYWLGHANSAFNPWLYILLSKRLNTALTRMVRRRFSRESTGSLKTKTIKITAHGAMAEACL